MALKIKTPVVFFSPKKTTKQNQPTKEKEKGKEMGM